MREERGPGFESHTSQERSPYNFVYFSPKDGPLVSVMCPGLKAKIRSPGWKTGTKASSRPGLQPISLLVGPSTAWPNLLLLMLMPVGPWRVTCLGLLGTMARLIKWCPKNGMLPHPIYKTFGPKKNQTLTHPSSTITAFSSS